MTTNRLSISLRLGLLVLVAALAVSAGTTPRPADELTFTTHDGKQVSLAEEYLAMGAVFGGALSTGPNGFEALSDWLEGRA